jgi:hypothetical protein
MHSSKELSSAMFAPEVAGRAATLADIFPGFDGRDRLGVVVRSPGGALGASALILAAVTAFYDLERARGGAFFRYPDYFLFHVGAPVGPYGMLDIWPDHKEVAVPAGDPEALLRAINDRAVTRLLVEDGPPGAPAFARATLASVGLRSALAYAPDGRTGRADIAIASNATAERYVAAVIDGAGPLADEERSRLRARRAALVEDGRPVERYRRLTTDEALALLASPVSPAVPLR